MHFAIAALLALATTAVSSPVATTEATTEATPKATPDGTVVYEIPLASDAPALDTDAASSFEVDTKLYDGAIFSGGYALCGWTECLGTSCLGMSQERLFFTAGDLNVGCVEMDNANIYNWSYIYQSSFNSNVCGVSTDFYQRSAGYWEFYENNGDGTLLGRCYSVQGSSHTCSIYTGTCAGVATRISCYWSGQGRKLCS